MKKIIQLFRFYGLHAFIILSRNIFFRLHQILGINDALLSRVYDYHMLLPLKYDGIGRVLYVLGERELDHKWMIDNEVSPGNVILDLGVNIGYYAIMEAKKMQGVGKIYAIEPDPRNIEFLKRNIELNNISDIVYFEQGAISNKGGQAKFTLSSKTNLNSFALEENDSRSITVPLFDFGEYLKDKDRIDLVRMDIEGHEIEVFESLIRYHAEFPKDIPRKIIFETHLRVYKKRDNQMREVLNKMFTIGYTIKYLSSAEESTTALHGMGYSPFKVVNDYPFIRGLYVNVNQEHAINCIVDYGGVRTVLLELKE
jgi:FkbM family methyltransferase